MRRLALATVSALGIAAQMTASDLTAVDGFGFVRPDVDLVLGFEHCAAPPDLYARLQDELVFAAGADHLLSGVASLAGLQSGGGAEGLLVAVRGSAMLAVVPSTKENVSLQESAGADASHRFRRLDQRLVAYGDLALLRDEAGPGKPATPSRPARVTSDLPANRCAWIVARPTWFRGDAPPALAAADVGGRSVLRSLEGIKSMTLTADSATDVDVTLRVDAAGPEDAAVLADALGEFLATRRRNTGAPQAVRDMLERAAVQLQSEVVTLRLPFTQAALDRIRRNQDSRALLRLRLEDGERERWQKIAEIVRALDLHEGDSVADVGAGEGFFSVRLARAVGRRGHVSAVEIGEDAIAGLARRAAAGSFDNVSAILGTAADPRLPKGSLDAVLIVNAYHEMPSHESMLARLFESLGPGGRLVLVEPWSMKRRDEPRADQVKDHLIAPELVEADLRRAGFEVSERRDDFVARETNAEWLIQARRPQRAPGPR